MPKVLLSRDVVFNESQFMSFEKEPSKEIECVPWSFPQEEKHEDSEGELELRRSTKNRAAPDRVIESQNINIQLERTVSLSTPTLESVGPWGLEPKCQLSPAEPRSILILSSVCRTPVAKGTDDPCSKTADARPWAPTSSCR
ncbi:hypothetical protein FHG87_024969 [Trinorchestia longiramus]|nr:hypothetical protein FHG87_024969 [Trinorchestia longiramus]